MVKLQFHITIIIFLFNWSLASQEIRGVIYSDNIPLPDVNIKIRGKSGGTKSDQKGEFNLKSKKGDLIIFSHVGMETKKIKGLDSLLSMAQMPKGVPVGCLAIDGAFNAGILAASIISNFDTKVKSNLEKWRRLQTQSIKKKPK